MSSSESRAETMKPLILKAGISAVVSVAAYVCERIVSKRPDTFLDTLSNRLERNLPRLESLRHDKRFPSPPSTSFDYPECQDQVTENLQVGQEGNLEDKLLELETQLEDLKNKELDLETRFLRYCNMRDKEMMLLEIENMKLVQKARVEFLLKEISLMEDENERVEKLVTEYKKLMNHLKGLKSENRLLRRKARKLRRRARQRLRVIRKKHKLCIEARDAELLSNQIELEMQDHHIQELDDEICQLKEVVDHLQREKIELYNKLNLAEKSDSNQMIQTDGVTKEEYDEVLKELEQLQNEHAVKAKELTYIKQSNACLRRELLRCHEQQEHTKGEISNQTGELELERNNGEAGNHNDMHDCEGALSAHEDEPCLCTGTTVATSGQVYSKRKRLIQKLKKLLDGGKMDEKEKNEMKCFGGHSASEETGDQFAHARMSCSSV